MFSLQLPSAVSRIVQLHVPERYGGLKKGTAFGAKTRSPDLELPVCGLSPDQLHWVSDDPGRSNSDQPACFKHRTARINRLRNKLWRLGLKKRFPKHTKPADTCVGCFETMLANCLETLPCGHKYCGQCIDRMASIAVVQETSFPPKCCLKEIPLQKILQTMSLRKQQIYISKIREYTTPISRRHYCPAPNCMKWIPPEFLESGASSHTCPYCDTVICSSCHCEAHVTSDCPSDPNLSAVLEEARIQQWQRCYSCGALVELTFGCNHITCNCKAQFCYKCGYPWASCTCVTATAQPPDFLAVAFNSNTPIGDEEAELAAVITAIIGADRDE